MSDCMPFLLWCLAEGAMNLIIKTDVTNQHSIVVISMDAIGVATYQVHGSIKYTDYL